MYSSWKYGSEFAGEVGIEQTWESYELEIREQSEEKGQKGQEENMKKVLETHTC